MIKMKNYVSMALVSSLCILCSFISVQADESISRSEIIEKKIVELGVNKRVPVNTMVEVLQTYLKVRKLGSSDRKIVENTLGYLLAHEGTYLLPNHGELSSPQSVGTYRLHHGFREKYLKFKDADIVSSYIYKKNNTEKIVYLTFDDGPYNQQKALVDYLIEERMPSTFFLICNKITAQNIAPYKTDFITLAMHTNTHRNYDELSKDQILNDIYECNKKFDKHNIPKKYFRPAFGVINRNESEALTQNNLEGVIWSMDSMDRGYGFHDERIEEMLDTVSPGEVILFHENADVEMFVKFVNGLKEKGYSFGKF